MKIRSGFVSNSSSSSFLIFGKKLDVKDITFDMIKKKHIICIGMDMSDGNDVIDVDTIEKLAILKAVDEICKMESYSKKFNSFYDFELEFIDVFATGNDDYHGEIDLSNIPTKKVEYFNIEKDYHCSDSLSDIKQNYDPDGRADNIAKKYLRATKIKKIEKNAKN